MPLIVPDVGVAAFLAARFNNSWPTSKDLTIRLFTNNITPADGDTTSSYTEAAGGGYSGKVLTCGSWSISVVGYIVQAAYAQQVFTFTGPLTGNATVYGYYVTDGDNVLQWAERMESPATPVSNGNHIDVTPIFQASKGTPA